MLKSRVHGSRALGLRLCNLGGRFSKLEVLDLKPTQEHYQSAPPGSRRSRPRHPPRSSSLANASFLSFRM